LEVAGEVRGELRVLFEYLEKIVSVNIVQIAVGQRADVAARLAGRLVYTHVLAEYVVFTCSPRPADLTIAIITRKSCTWRSPVRSIGLRA